MLINTRKLLTAYIREQLGEPVINVEVPDSAISQIIDDTIQKFTEYAYGVLEGVVLCELKGMGEYDLPPRVTNIKKIAKGTGSNMFSFDTNFGAGYVPDIWTEFYTSTLTSSAVNAICAISAIQSILDNYFGDDINYNFNAWKKTLQVFENYSGKVLIWYQYEYEPDDEDYIFNQEWVKRYCIAKTKLLWGTITGKYSQSLIGGAQINYSDMKSEAQTEIDALEEELKSKWCDPCPILIS